MNERNIRDGILIPTEGYSDQPFIVKTRDGAWLLCVTTGSGDEGEAGQHIRSFRSTDEGRTWGEVADVTAPDGPETSYAVMYPAKSGRVYIFFNRNSDRMKSVIACDPPYAGGKCDRVDTLGHFVYKWSDDCGRTWSKEFRDIPMRLFEVDRLNPYHGEVCFFWNVGKPFRRDNEVFVPIYKIREFGEGFMRHSEGALFMSPNIDTETDPDRIEWVTLPEGERGIKATEGIVSEEHSFAVLSDGSVECVFRTVTGCPYMSVSRDGCRSFSEPVPLTRACGRRVPHPRAANFLWKCEDGTYLYWCHFQGGNGYSGRNPAFILRGRETDAQDGRVIALSEPFPLLYDDDPLIRFSYPDMAETKEGYAFTETQKREARVHLFDRAYIARAFGDEKAEWRDLPEKLPPFLTVLETRQERPGVLTRACFTLRLSGRFPQRGSILSTMDEKERGIALTRDGDMLTLLFSDGQTNHIARFGIPDGKEHDVRVAFDGDAGNVYFVTDGVFRDGDGTRDYGFTRMSRGLTDITGGRAKVCEGVRALYADGLCLYND